MRRQGSQKTADRCGRWGARAVLVAALGLVLAAGTLADAAARAPVPGSRAHARAAHAPAAVAASVRRLAKLSGPVQTS